MRFSLNSGYSVIWLLLLYSVGAIMKKISVPEKLTKGKCVLCILILYILTWCWKIIIGGDIKIMTLSVTNDSLVSYTSPTIVCISILYLALFAQIKTGPITTSVIRFLAPGAFSVYLLNDNRLIRAHYIEGRFDMIVVENSWHLFLIIVCFAIAFTIIALFVDKPRQLLFNKMLIKKRIEKCADRLIG